MKNTLIMMCFAILFCNAAFADEKKAANPCVTMETSKGTIVLES